MTLGMAMMWVVVGLIVGYLAGYVMKEPGYGQIRDIVVGLFCTLLLMVAFLAVAWGPGSFRSWEPLRARRCSRRSSSHAAGRPS